MKSSIPKVLNADGDKITVHCCKMEIKATINGKMVGYGYLQLLTTLGAVARIGTTTAAIWSKLPPQLTIGNPRVG